LGRTHGCQIPVFCARRHDSNGTPSRVGEYQVYGAMFVQFKARYDELGSDGR